MIMQVEEYNVLIADDHQLIVNGICLLLADKVKNFYCANDVKRALELALAHKPEVAVVDVSMPDLTGDMLVREIRYRCPETRIICYTFHTEEEVVMKMLNAGVHAYVIKNSDEQSLRKAFDAVVNNEEYFCEEAKVHMINKLRNFSPCDKQLYRYGNDIQLNTKEIEIIRLLCKGKTAKETSKEVYLSERTVEQYRNNIAKKLRTKNLVGIIKFALHNGIIKQSEM